MTTSSMTGFARVQGNSDQGHWVWEVRAVNGKGLDIRFRLPGFAGVLEEELRQIVRAEMSRGSLQVSLQFEPSDGDMAVSVNRPLAMELLKELKHLAKETGFEAPGIKDILQVRGVLESTSISLNVDVLRKPLLQTFRELVAALVTARKAEGGNLERLLLGGLAKVEELCQIARANPATDLAQIHAGLQARIAVLHETIDPDRLAQEATVLAVKADVTEELDRLGGHVQAARDLLRGSGSKGRKLEFLAQEFHREANTLCAKSQDAALTATGLELKTVIDQIREQAANVE